MPIIVDPSALNPAPPEEAVSPDGLLRARLDEDNAGVLLEADYSVEPLVQAHFVRDREGWITYALGGTTPSWTWTPGSFGIANDAEEGSALGIQKDFGGIGTGLAPIKVRVVVEADEDLVATRFRVSIGGDFYDGATPKAGRTEYEFQAVNPAAGLSWVAVHLSGSVAGEQSFRIVEVTITEVAAREDFDGGSIDAWSTYQNGGGGVVTLDYDANWDGGKVSWTSAASSVGAIWTLPERLPGNRAYRVRFLVRGLTLNAQRLRVALAPPSGGSFDFLDLPNPRPVNRVWEVEGIVPKGQTLGRIFFYANGNVSANQTVIFARPVVEQAPPQAVRVLRGGTPILSGDPATAVGGKAVVYDHHAPLGVPSTWTAIPVYLDGRTAGETEGVSLTVPEPTG